MKQRAKIIIIITVIAVIVAGAFLVNYLISVQRYQNAVDTMTFANIDISQIPDGTYIGECDVDYIYAKVSVTVKNGTLVQIDLLEHRNERGGAAEGIEQRIVDEQRIDVDAISGATNSSKVIKKAAENALLNAEY